MSFIQLGRVDELGSGVINVYKYLQEYSPGREPQFIEDKLFQTIIPIGNIVKHDIKSLLVRSGDAVNDAVNDAVSVQVKSRIVEELKWIHKKEGSRLSTIMEEFNIQRATAQRDMKIIKDAGLIRFVGSVKSGKYTLTDKGMALF